QVCDWTETPTCLQQSLISYFGESLAQPCGQCSACQSGPLQLPPRQRAKPDTGLIQRLHDEGHEALTTPRQLARFLCGIGSPRASRARLGKHPLFGALMDAPFAEVLAACELTAGQSSPISVGDGSSG